jgi:hypothetical protein
VGGWDVTGYVDQVGDVIPVPPSGLQLNGYINGKQRYKYPATRSLWLRRVYPRTSNWGQEKKIMTTQKTGEQRNWTLLGGPDSEGLTWKTNYKFLIPQCRSTAGVLVA